MTDLVMKMKALEESMSGFMKQNGEQMRVLTDTVVKVKAAPTIRNVALSTSTGGNDALDTPGAKKRKAGEMDGNIQIDGNGLMEGITPIPGMNYVDAAKKNNQQMLQSQFFQQQQQQQQQHLQQQQQRALHAESTESIKPTGKATSFCSCLW